MSGKRKSSPGIKPAQHGGARAGAGRKPKAHKQLATAALGSSIADWFTEDTQKSSLQKLLGSRDENVRLRTLIYLMDRMYGKPAQAVQHTGELDHKITLVVDL